MLLHYRENTPESRGRGRADGDHLKSSKSETTLYPNGDGEQAGPGPAKSVPNLEGMGTPDELKIRYDNSLRLLFHLYCVNWIAAQEENNDCIM